LNLQSPRHTIRFTKGPQQQSCKKLPIHSVAAKQRWIKQVPYEYCKQLGPGKVVGSVRNHKTLCSNNIEPTSKRKWDLEKEIKMNSEKSNMMSWSLNKKDYTNKNMHTNAQGSPVVVLIMLIIMVKFSLLHRNMEVTDEKQEHSLHWICVNQVILSLKFFYISWPLDITSISSPPSLGQDSEVNAIGHIAKQEETMTYND
jgi:hypothetical protein